MTSRNNRLAFKNRRDLTNWVEQNLGNVDGLTAAQIAELAEADLSFRITRANIMAAYEDLDAPLPRAKAKGGIPEGMQQQLKDIEEQLATTRYEITRLKNQVAALEAAKTLPVQEPKGDREKATTRWPLHGNVSDPQPMLNGTDTEGNQPPVRKEFL